MTFRFFFPPLQIILVGISPVFFWDVPRSRIAVLQSMHPFIFITLKTRVYGTSSCSSSLLTLSVIRLFKFCQFDGCEIIFSFLSYAYGLFTFYFCKVLTYFVQFSIFFPYRVFSAGVIFVYTHAHTVIQWPSIKIKDLCFCSHIWPWLGIKSDPFHLENSFLLL